MLSKLNLFQRHTTTIYDKEKNIFFLDSQIVIYEQVTKATI